VTGFEPAASSSRIRPWKVADLLTSPKAQVRALACVGLRECPGVAIPRSSPGFLQNDDEGGDPGRSRPDASRCHAKSSNRRQSVTLPAGREPSGPAEIAKFSRVADMAKKVQALTRCAVCTADLSAALTNATGWWRRQRIRSRVPSAASTTVNGTAMCARHAPAAQQGRG
jgi:hypothetical protein